MLAVLAIGVRAVERRVATAGATRLTAADPTTAEPDVSESSGGGVAFDGELLDGRRWSSGSARGRVLVVNVWASWCVPCRAEQPELSAAARAWQGEPVQFIGVNLRDARAAARSWEAEFHVSYPSLYDQSGAVAAKLQVIALPATIILGRDGVMAYRLTGPVTAEQLDERIATLLGQARRWRS